MSDLAFIAPDVVGTCACIIVAAVVFIDLIVHSGEAAVSAAASVFLELNKYAQGVYPPDLNTYTFINAIVSYAGVLNGTFVDDAVPMVES